MAKKRRNGKVGVNSSAATHAGPPSAAETTPSTRTGAETVAMKLTKNKSKTKKKGLTEQDSAATTAPKDIKALKEPLMSAEARSRALIAGDDPANALAASLAPFSISFSRCRHWRYNSCYYGTWIRTSAEVLAQFAAANLSGIGPRFIDANVILDLVRIRRLVADATDLSVRAASGIVGPRINGDGGAGAARLGDPGPDRGRSVRMSPERQHRVRLEAAQKLSVAYEIDEMATSVATSNCVSSLDDVAGLALGRSSNDRYARYVHFFHEKVPSREIRSTTTETLDALVAANPQSVPLLRTRAVVHQLRDNQPAAIVDLTEALRRAREYAVAVKRGQVAELDAARRMREEEAETMARATAAAGPKKERGGNCGSGISANGSSSNDSNNGKKASAATGAVETSALAAEASATLVSLERQLLFQRAMAHMDLATKQIYPAMGRDWLKCEQDIIRQASGDRDQNVIDDLADKITVTTGGAACKEAEAQRLLRTNAKRALRDLLAFLGHFHYCSNLPLETAESYARRVANVALRSANIAWNVQHGLARVRALGAVLAAQVEGLRAMAGPDGVVPNHLPDHVLDVHPMSDLFTNAELAARLPTFPPALSEAGRERAEMLARAKEKAHAVARARAAAEAKPMEDKVKTVEVAEEAFREAVGGAVIEATDGVQSPVKEPVGALLPLDDTQKRELMPEVSVKPEERLEEPKEPEHPKATPEQTLKAKTVERHPVDRRVATIESSDKVELEKTVNGILPETTVHRTATVESSDEMDAVETACIGPPTTTATTETTGTKTTATLRELLVSLKDRTALTMPTFVTLEMETFHPLLEEALHAMLLVHCLLQTPPRELERHATMAARLTSLIDGYPLFQPEYSGSRQDWTEILRLAGGPGWLEFPVHWDAYCDPGALGTDLCTTTPTSTAAAVAFGAVVGGHHEAAQPVRSLAQDETLRPLHERFSMTSTSDRAIAISYWLCETMRRNYGVVSNDRPSGAVTGRRRRRVRAPRPSPG